MKDQSKKFTMFVMIVLYPAWINYFLEKEMKRKRKPTKKFKRKAGKGAHLRQQIVSREDAQTLYQATREYRKAA